uniref:Uncharacterized protein n=1 Tax=Arundo donax TaxID=35708 RepID=A0A0A9BLT2_ARUDO
MSTTSSDSDEPVSPLPLASLVATNPPPRLATPTAQHQVSRPCCSRPPRVQLWCLAPSVPCLRQVRPHRPHHHRHRARRF